MGESPWVVADSERFVRRSQVQDEVPGMRVSRRTLLATALLGLAKEASSAPQDSTQKLAPYFPTPHSVVEKMLRLAAVKPSDTVYDLGSGDGRIVIMAAEKFGAKAVGVEYDASLVTQSRMAIKRKKLENRASIIHGDMLVQDYSPATVLTVYLLPTSNDKMRPILEKQLRPGTRIVCHDFEFSGWTPVETLTIEDDGEGRSHTLFLYTIK
jgi:protein-L-isoaspartate O-methyltransferase